MAALSQETSDVLLRDVDVVHLDETVCRVCLHVEGTVSLFDGLGTDEQFRYCTLLEAAEDDGLPSKLCQMCVEHMRIAYDFRFQAAYAEKYFRKTIFLPALKETEASEYPCGTTEQVVLDENMQEIDKLLTHHTSSPDTTTENLYDKDEQERGVITTQMTEKISDTTLGCNYSDSDGLSDHFAEAFADADTADKRDRIEKEEKYKSCWISSVLQGNNTEKGSNSNKKANGTNTNVKATIVENIPKELFTNEQNEEILIKIKQKRRKDGKVECNVCGATFTHINSLKQHLLKHTGERPFRCEFCGKSFARSTILNIHRRLHTGDRPYSCDECIRTFVTKEAMNRHKDREHKEEKNVTTADTKNPNYTCSICSKTRSSKSSLLAHLRTYHREEQTVKQKSNQKKPYTSKVKRKRSIEKPRRALPLFDEDGKPLPTVKYCKICQQSFPSKWELVVHQETHKSTQLFQCGDCLRTFEKKYQLLCHMQTHDNADALIAKCLEFPLFKFEKGTAVTSDEETKPLAQLIKERKQSKKKNNKIQRDSNGRKGKEKDSIVALSEQLKCEADIWHCKLCKTSFTHVAALRMHMRRHAGEGLYTCEHCNRTFTRQRVLNMHQRLHSNQRRLKRPPCDEVFANKETSLVHITEAHESVGEVSGGHSCSLDSGNSADYKNITLMDEHANHVNLDHPPEVLQCEICQMKFVRKFKLLFHLELHKLTSSQKGT